MPKANPKSERIYIRLSPALYERLKQMMYSQGLPSLSDTGREAIRYYLDEMSDQIGSCRHFSRSMQKRFDSLEDLTHLHLALQTYLLAHFLAQVLSNQEQMLAGLVHDGRQVKVWKGSELLAEATRIAMSQQIALRATVARMQELAAKQHEEAEARKITGA